MIEQEPDEWSRPERYRAPSLPEPRPLQHGYEAICWADAPLIEAYGMPGEGHHGPSSINNRSK